MITLVTYVYPFLRSHVTILLPLEGFLWSLELGTFI